MEELLPAGEKPVVQAYFDKYLWLVRRRLPQLARGTAAWWLEQRPFFGGLQRERIWVLWRRVLFRIGYSLLLHGNHSADVAKHVVICLTLPRLSSVNVALCH